MNRRRVCSAAVLIVASDFCNLWTLHAAEVEPKEITLKVGDVERTALVFVPDEKTEGPRPVVFVFHGHGGTARSAARLGFQTAWPEAIVVLPHGLPTPGRLTDPEGKRNGWQHAAGDQSDRDLHFFDVLLKRLQADYSVDNRRIYSTGHSNGGAFTYLLWIERGEKFAALAPSAAAAGALRTATPPPKPIMHVGAENDPLVKYEWQKATIDRALKVNKCAAEGKASGDHLTEYASEAGAPLVTYLHDGGHRYPSDATKEIVAFFKKHTLPEAK